MLNNIKELKKANNKKALPKIKHYKTEKNTLFIKLNASFSYFGSFVTTNKLKTELKAEKDWLKEVNSQSLQTAIRNCDRAFVNFFHNTGKYPNFKNKFTKQSFQNVQLV